MSLALRDLVPRLRQHVDRSERSRIVATGLRGSAAALCLAELLRGLERPVLAILRDATAAEAFAADLRFYLGEAGAHDPLGRRVHHLPGWEIPPFEFLSPARETLAARAEGLHHLLQTRGPVVVATVEALGLRYLPREAFVGAVTYLVAGETMPPDTLAARLLDWGYHRVPLVQDPGDLAVRGGIVDVFPAGYARPVRLEFVGDVVESIRAFDAGSQRSLDALEELLVLPMQEFSRSRFGGEAARRVDARAAELGLARQARRELVEALRSGLVLPGSQWLLPYLYDELGTLADYLPRDTVVWAVEAGALEAAAEIGWRAVEEHAVAAQREGRFLPEPDRLFLPPAAVRAMLTPFVRVDVEALDELAGEALRALSYGTATLPRRAAADQSPLTPVVAELDRWQREGTRLVLVASSRAQRERIVHLLTGHGLTPLVTDAPFPEATATADTTPLALVGALSAGARLPADGLAIVTEAELFGERRQVRRGPAPRAIDFLSTLAELVPDDFVVHVDHGIARYRGLKHLQVAGTEGDYLHLEYQDGDRLYVPVDRIDVVQRYASADGAPPALDKLGGTSWERTKARAKESLLAMAHELIGVQAQREAHGRRPYGTADALYEEFVARFPFEETPGQQRAIDEVVADLQRGRPMDRLVCGDVGFGKTEVAMRAAFLAVVAGKQVAVLVPTTILAQQHLETFARRFAGYPISIDMVSRFRTASENRAILARAADGTVDVVIGTHRLLQRDVRFRNLGLLVVDEEHRFGVRDKERIRALRATVDVLTLTATPIPRTLNMALSGIRDLSVIETPPVDRLAIRTYVTRHDETVIRDAVVRELERGGQVFFVHNRVESIERVADRLRALVPEATIAVAHGQMPEAALETVMADFMHGKSNVLVTSAIIESGLDIPRANTLIVDRADTFGLAQLYQIRGRVGRSHQRAYAYLLIPGEHLITPEAQKRLRVLQELDDLGGGFRLAAHDLEIRGAGNLLGKQQSGHIAAVGLELYTQLLDQAVREVRGEPAEVEVEPEIQLGISAFIPEAYVPDERQRLVLYKRLAQIRGIPDVEAMREELVDRFGALPPPVDTLLRLMELRRWLKDLRVLAARRRGETVVLEFDPSTPVAVETLFAQVRRSSGRLRMISGSALQVRPRATDHDGLIAELREILRDLAPSAAAPVAARAHGW